VTPTTIGNWLLIAATTPAVLSVVVFARVRWFQSRWGRHLMAYMLSIAVVLGLGVVRLFLGDHPWFDWLRVGAFASVVAVLWWRLIYILQALAEGSPDDTARTVPDPRASPEGPAPIREEAP
jgi:hypothetical protein